MPWSPRYATGIPHLDAQHQVLFRMVDDFRLALDDGDGHMVYGEFLRMLELYSRTHFGAEEECMYRFQCPAARENLDGHVNFKVMLDEFQASFDASGFLPETAQDAAGRLEHWLVAHIGRIDTQLRPLVDMGLRAS